MVGRIISNIIMENKACSKLPTRLYSFLLLAVHKYQVMQALNPEKKLKTNSNHNPWVTENQTTTRIGKTLGSLRIPQKNLLCLLLLRISFAFLIRDTLSFFGNRFPFQQVFCNFGIPFFMAMDVVLKEVNHPNLFGKWEVVYCFFTTIWCVKRW